MSGAEKPIKGRVKVGPSRRHLGCFALLDEKTGKWLVSLHCWKAVADQIASALNAQGETAVAEQSLQVEAMEYLKQALLDSLVCGGFTHRVEVDAVGDLLETADCEELVEKMNLQKAKAKELEQ